MGKVEWYVYKLSPTYKPNSITLQQIHVLDDEYRAVSKKQKISKNDRKQLLEIDKQTATWMKQNTHARKQHPIRQPYIPQKQQQQQQQQK